MMSLIGNLGYTGTAAVLAIFIIIYLQFKNIKKPLIIITSIPLSLIGCCLGLWMFGMDLQAMALLGAVSLFGIVVNNAIILMEYIDFGVAKDRDAVTACKDAISMRYRAIMMTSITTCIGLVPLITAKDPMTAPMASVLLFGLLFSTILTMVVVPVLYVSAQTEKEKKRNTKIIKSRKDTIE
jgi:multidrug efflux pump subunit AcrB